MTLNIERGLVSLLLPHFRGEIRFGVDNLILPSIDVKVGFLHLRAEFPHHDGRFGFVLISLHFSLDFIRMVACILICLGESVIVDHVVFVVFETSQVGFLFGAFFNFYLDCFSLVIGQQDVDWENGRHLKLVCFYRVEVVPAFLTLRNSVLPLLLHHLFLEHLLFKHGLLVQLSISFMLLSVMLNVLLVHHHLLLLIRTYLL